MAEERLKEFLESAEGWSRLKTSIPGVMVLKMPASKSREASLALEVNPLNEAGVPSKRRGLIIRSLEELYEFREILMEEKLETLLELVESLNPSRPKDRFSDETLVI